MAAVPSQTRRRTTCYRDRRAAAHGHIAWLCPCAARRTAYPLNLAEAAKAYHGGKADERGEGRAHASTDQGLNAQSSLNRNAAGGQTEAEAAANRQRKIRSISNFQIICILLRHRSLGRQAQYCSRTGLVSNQHLHEAGT